MPALVQLKEGNAYALNAGYAGAADDARQSYYSGPQHCYTNRTVNARETELVSEPVQGRFHGPGIAARRGSYGSEGVRETSSLPGYSNRQAAAAVAASQGGDEATVYVSAKQRRGGKAGLEGSEWDQAAGKKSGAFSRAGYGKFNGSDGCSDGSGSQEEEEQDEFEQGEDGEGLSPAEEAGVAAGHRYGAAGQATMGSGSGVSGGDDGASAAGGSESSAAAGGGSEELSTDAR